ncbi:MAG: hypothetical protein IT364_21570 [Candidatus Hydrogenedentes bacterium]|nr:hypothetical protein [Candidatus Hydrogenedentota bacterium]
MSSDLPKSIAIAGAWGYIGRKFLNAALDLGVKPYVLDPAPRPPDVDPGGVHVIGDAEQFYALDVDLFHLALHPDMRERPLATLFERSRSGKGPAILCEKPMTTPDNPRLCDWIVAQSEAVDASLFFDFPELFDPIARHVCAFLSNFERVRFDEIRLNRSKDREDPSNPRNYKVMVPIQYQETVHSIAYVLNLLAVGRSGFGQVCRSVRAEGTSELYCPPNPEAYTGPVDGKFEGMLTLDGTKAQLSTNFKAGAPWTKRQRIRGVGDGTPFLIEAEFLEGAKYLRINGEALPIPPETDSYQNVIRQLWAWHTEIPANQRAAGLYPNARLARCTFLLSCMLWESCAKRIAVESVDLESYAASINLNPATEWD